MKHQKSELEQALIESWNTLSEAETKSEDKDLAEAGATGPTADTGAEAPEQARPDTHDAQADDEDHADAQEGDTALEAPAHWPEDDRAAFATLPEEMQQFLLRRSKETDADYTRKTQELAEQRKALAPIQGVTAAWGDYFREIGVDPASAINHVMGVERTLRSGTPEEKRSVLAQLVRDYGISHAAANPGAPQTHDPAITTLQQQLNALQGQLQTNHQQQARQQAARMAEFAAQTDEKGRLAHPHFAEVRETMVALAQNGQAKSLAQAYDMAIWARPDLREKLLSAREAQQMETRSQSAAKARKAARANVRGSGAPAKTAKPKSLEEELAQVWEELSRS